MLEKLIKIKKKPETNVNLFKCALNCQIGYFKEKLGGHTD